MLLNLTIFQFSVFSFFLNHNIKNDKINFLKNISELQLKDHHIPFLLRKQWADLLKEFSSCKEEDERLAGETMGLFFNNLFKS